PIQGGVVRDWPALAAFWQYLFFHHFHVDPRRNDTHVTLLTPMRWTPHEVERAVQILFEAVRVPSVLVIEQPAAVLYAMNLGTGVVIDFGAETTAITAVVENSVVRHTAVCLDVGGHDMDACLLAAMRKAGTVPPHLLTLAFARAVRTSGLFEPYPLEQPALPADRRRLIASGAAVPFVYEGETVMLGPERFAFIDVYFAPDAECQYESGPDAPLVSIAQKRGVALPEMLAHVINTSVLPDRRVTLWESLVLCGGVAQQPGLYRALERHLLADVLAVAETSNEQQAKEVRALGFAEYFTAFKGRPDLGTILGGIVITKSPFANMMTYVSRERYDAFGPS
ncbi:hypothetical protein CXG81DRAFT_2104, partial [Caulochytrium protostelioides]